MSCVKIGISDYTSSRMRIMPKKWSQRKVPKHHGGGSNKNGDNKQDSILGAIFGWLKDGFRWLVISMSWYHHHLLMGSEHPSSVGGGLGL